MYKLNTSLKFDVPLTLAILFIIGFSLLILNSIAQYLFPGYFVYVVVSLLVFVLFTLVDFSILRLFSWHFYVGSIFLLLLPLAIGQVTRGAVRWIPIGNLTLQPAELVRPFLLVFFANYLAKDEVSFKTLVKAGLLLTLPLFLIIIQPSLGVAILTSVAFLGVLFASTFDKKYLFAGLLALSIIIPLSVRFLAPYQRARIETFLNPTSDPLGAGYNSIQSTIAVGSGMLFGRGLGKGVQTQLAFLPERHTDFIFASTAEELGFGGAAILLVATFFLIFRITGYMNSAKDLAGRMFISGLSLTLLVQMVVNIGMNLGLLPITGLPLPLFSAGGSSLLGTMISLGLAQSVRRG